MHDGFSSDDHTYGDGLPYRPRQTDGSTDDLDEDMYDNTRQTLDSLPPNVNVRPFQNGMGYDNESVEVDVNGVVDAINSKQAAAIRYHEQPQDAEEMR